MINRKYLFTVLLYLLVNNIYSQEVKFNINDILGKWNSYKITTSKGGDGSNITLNGKPLKKTIMMNFIDSKTMLFSQGRSEEYQIEYQIKDNMIILSSERKYTIKAITDKILTLKVEDGFLGNIIYLKKNNH